MYLSILKTGSYIQNIIGPWQFQAKNITKDNVLHYYNPIFMRYNLKECGRTLDLFLLQINYFVDKIKHFYGPCHVKIYLRLYIRSLSENRFILYLWSTYFTCYCIVVLLNLELKIVNYFVILKTNLKYVWCVFYTFKPRIV